MFSTNNRAVCESRTWTQCRYNVVTVWMELWQTHSVSDGNSLPLSCDYSKRHLPVHSCRRTAKTQTHFNSNSHLETFIQCHFKLDINRFDQTLTNEHFSSCCVDFILTRADEAPQKVSVTDAFVEMLHFTGVFDSHDWFIL